MSTVIDKATSCPHIYNQSLALLTDFYQLTMSYGYWKNNLHNKEAVFHLFFRKRPFGGGFTVSAGLEYVIDYLKNFHFDDTDLAYLETQRGADGELLFEKGFLDYLANIKFSCKVDAVPEGTVVFPYEPMLRVEGPLIQAQLLETPLLNLINFPTIIATKAARVCFAAKGDTVLEFGLRRAQGIDGALTASRAAYIGGCHYTSNVLAGKLFGIPVKGTHSHSWVMIFDEEIDSFKAFAKALPANCVFLVDTYNSIEGVKKAIEVGKWLDKQGKRMLGIRLDSGDLAYLSKVSRKMLDDAGFPDAQIVASNELDETLISELKRQGAKIDVWGVGTNLITAKDQPALDGVYKLSAVRDAGKPWKYRLKLSEQMTKISNPGILQVRRYYDEKENLADAVYDVNADLSQGCKILDPLDPTRHKVIGSETKYKDLLVPIFREGECVYQPPPLDEVRENVQRELAHFHDGIKRFLNPHQYAVGMEESLYKIKVDLIEKVRQPISQ
ncbi:MAG: Nicotinate phosphoribosyltransferase pncB2 [Chlamydiae bacterium]|nr:Nicotinate phosphoribosyltransferase pncB2 [Chlamydiota bacterium]